MTSYAADIWSQTLNQAVRSWKPTNLPAVAAAGVDLIPEMSDDSMAVLRG